METMLRPDLQGDDDGLGALLVMLENQEVSKLLWNSKKGRKDLRFQLDDHRPLRSVIWVQHACGNFIVCFFSGQFPPTFVVMQLRHKSNT